jgi:DNA-binding PadR family transcriptional regulator
MTRQPDPTRFTPLAPHDFQVLLSLLGREMHGYSLIKDIALRTEGEMKLGTSTVYAALKRMTTTGLIAETTHEREGASEGPPRTYYGITELGMAVARHEALRIRRLGRMVSAIPLLDAPGRVAPGEGSCTYRQDQRDGDGEPRVPDE